ncbi:hypothetical protein CSC43_0521 [Pseudomonas aeruginosa]|nr:hypothetical protein CSC43_0521 [Pseudomonas aeruginosa]
MPDVPFNVVLCIGQISDEKRISLVASNAHPLFGCARMAVANGPNAN